VEAVVRLDLSALPTPAGRDALGRLFGRDPRPARRVAASAAAAHAAALLLLAADWGYFVPGGFLPSPWYVGAATLVWTVAGLLATGGGPVYLLARRRLLTPTLALAWLVRQQGWLQNMPMPDDPLPVYFVGWPFFLGALLLLGGVEYTLRALWRRVRGTAGSTANAGTEPSGETRQ
jgi:hypothetical protein